MTDTNFDLYNIAGYQFPCKNNEHTKCGSVTKHVSYRYEYVVREDLSLFDELIFESLFLEMTILRNKILFGEVNWVLNANHHESIVKYDSLLNMIDDENVYLIIGTDQNIHYLIIDANHATNLFITFVSLRMVPNISRSIRIT